MHPSEMQGLLDRNCAMIARFLIGGFFFVSGLENILSVFSTAERMGMPGAFYLVVIAASVKMLFGGMVALRYHVRYAAVILMFYVIATNIILYGPQTWAEQEMYEFIFMRNIAIVGGLLFVYAYSRDYTRWVEDCFPSEKQRQLGKPEKSRLGGPPH